MIYDVIIIGAGVTGALTARKLSRYELSVCMLESGADVASGASKANSAIAHGGFDPVPGTLKAELNVRGTAMMKEITDELDVHYKNNGSLVVSFDAARKGDLEELYNRGIANGVPGLSLLTGDEARALEPRLSENVTDALLCESAGIVCPYELTIAAAGNAMDNGAGLKLGFRVSDVTYDGELFTVTDGKEKLSSRYLVNCAGSGACTIAGMLGETYTPVPKKGEYMLFDKSEGRTVSRTVFQLPTAAGKGVLVTPTVDGNLLIGPTSEKCGDNDKTTTQEGLDTIRKVASLSVDRLDFRKVITSFTGVRASVAESDDFIIKASGAYPKAINAIGIDSPGLSASPAIAEYIFGLLREAGLDAAEKKDFVSRRVSCRHFGSLSDDEKNELIAREPAYGHVICRCETVTEGEILAALRQNPAAKTLDGVKRRTRSGMGRCQGGFCTPFITELLAKELGTDETGITKCGEGSELLLGHRFVK